MWCTIFKTYRNDSGISLQQTFIFILWVAFYKNIARRYFCCGCLLLLILAVRIYNLFHLLCEWHILVKWPPVWERVFIPFTARAFHKLLWIYVFSFFHFGFEGRIWNLIVSVPDHCLSFYFVLKYTQKQEKRDIRQIKLLEYQIR